MRSRYAGLFILLSLLCVPWAREPLAESEEGTETKPQAMDIVGHEGLWPKFSLHGFGDASFSSSRVQEGVAANTDTFAIGALDLCMTSLLADNLSFLGEVTFETPQDMINGEQTSVVDVERLSLKYTLSDAFSLTIGRIHTPFGYWNETFHHGLFLQPIVFRPQALRFEDDGGILPDHSVGVDVAGNVFKGPWGLGYAVTIANGRGPVLQEVQNTRDANRQKATTLKLFASRERNSRIFFGAMYDHDLIPPNPGVPGRDSSIKESIVGAHFVYLSQVFDFYSEYYRVHHQDQSIDLDLTHPAYYAIAVLKHGHWSPYAGIDQMNIQDGDPYYEGQVTAVDRSLVGVRWDFHPLAAVKFEYQHDKIPGVTSDNLFVQVSFTF